MIYQMTKEHFNKMKCLIENENIHEEKQKEYFDNDPSPLNFNSSKAVKSEDGRTSVFTKDYDFFVMHENKWVAWGFCYNNINLFGNIVIAASNDSCVVYDPVSEKSKSWNLC